MVLYFVCVTLILPQISLRVYGSGTTSATILPVYGTPSRLHMRRIGFLPAKTPALAAHNLASQHPTYPHCRLQQLENASQNDAVDCAKTNAGYRELGYVFESDPLFGGGRFTED
jgi:hypothetical protein